MMRACGEYGVSWLSLCEPCLRAGGGNPPTTPAWLHVSVQGSASAADKTALQPQVQQSAGVAVGRHGSSARRLALTRGRRKLAVDRVDHPERGRDLLPGSHGRWLRSQPHPPLLSHQVAALLTAVVIEHARECSSACG